MKHKMNKDMKVKKGLKEFIKENMIFDVDSEGNKGLVVKNEKLSTLSKEDFNYARKLVESYLDRQSLRTLRFYPELRPGLVVELVCKERYLIINNVVSITGEDDCISYKMIGLNETLDTCMYNENLKVKRSYSKLSAKLLDISRIYRVDDYAPGLNLLLGEGSVPEYSLVEIWKR